MVRRSTAAVCGAALAALALVGGVAAVDGDAGDAVEIVADARVLREEAVSEGFGRAEPDLVVSPDGTLWAAFGDGRLVRFDDRLRVVETIDATDPLHVAGGIAVTAEGAVVAAGWVPATEVDGHGDPLGHLAVFRVGADGSTSLLATVSPPTERVRGACPPLVDGATVYVCLLDGRIAAVDLTSGAVTHSGPIEQARNVTLGAGDVWLATGAAVVRLDGDDLSVVETVPFPGANEVALADGVPWVHVETGAVERLDGAGSLRRSSIPLDVAGAAALWTNGNGVVAAHDPATGEPLGEAQAVRHGELVASGDTAWVFHWSEDGTIHRYALRR